MQNVMVTLTFSVLNQNYPFWENSVQKIKIVTLSWNFVPRLIGICRNTMVEFTFSDLDQKYSFWGELDPKYQNCYFKLKCGT